MDYFNVDEWIRILKPIVYLAIGFAIYAVFIFKFYRFTAHKDIFKLYLYKREMVRYAELKNFVKFLLYILEYLIIFPFVVMVWFAVLVILFILISKIGDLELIMIMSMVVVSSIRITAYYNEDLARDVAKLIPFALMAYFLIDNASYIMSPTFFNYPHFEDIARQMSVLANNIPYYLIYLIVLEFILRILHALFNPLLKNDKDFQGPTS